MSMSDFLFGFFLGCFFAVCMEELIRAWVRIIKEGE